MAETHLVSGLKQRRAERMGELHDLRRKMRELEVREGEVLALLAHVDAVLRVEAPELELERIKPRKQRSAQAQAASGNRRVPITKAVLGLLRTRQVAMSAEEVTEELRSDYTDLDAGKLMQNVRTFMSNKKTAGVLTADESAGRPLRYLIAA